ncbi:MAG: O-antigen ligase family protein [Treponema sp.]|nr:O-antigen ligase family protein [Treponema sp.]
MLIMSLLLFFTTIKKLGIINSISLVITYLLIFDSAAFSFTSFNIRVWYILLIPLVGYYFCINISFTKKIDSVFTLCIFSLLGLMITYLFIDPKDGKLSIIKYLLFSIGLIYVLYKSFLKIIKKGYKTQLFSFFISLGLFVASWGIIQYLTWNTPLHQKFQYDWFNMRPSAFFSETTWYSEYILFSLVFLFYRFIKKSTIKDGFGIFICLIGIILSSTRNTYLAIFVWVFVALVISIMDNRVNKKVLLSLFITCILFFILIRFTDLGMFFDKIIERFKGGDNGRMTAVKRSLNDISKSPIIGHGFSFNGEYEGAGTYVGAKNFNFFFMCLHTIGLVGFNFLIILLLSYGIKCIMQYLKFRRDEAKIAVIFISCFLSISMFAPMHQSFIGMFVIAMSIALYNSVTIKQIVDIEIL